MTKRTLNVVELRYVLTFYLAQHGRTTVGNLVEALDYYNFAVQGRASKSVSDALRWEAALGRVRSLLA
ncbi:hypothetical protein [Mycobacterium deserti]|uniref:Uncharacterized protein n=1 Tax=Mycobacterium deserti TaxID=2978347 RepID=A0ABT2M9L7_9MYCO|nr:hypothetical protein [Mycobacterium deserti]